MDAKPKIHVADGISAGGANSPHFWRIQKHEIDYLMYSIFQGCTTPYQENWLEFSIIWMYCCFC